MNSLLVTITLVVLGLVYLVSNRSDAPSSRLMAFGRLVATLLLIGAGFVAYLVIGRIIGMTTYLPEKPVVTIYLTLLLMGAYVVKQSGRRKLSVAGVFSAVVLGGLSYGLFYFLYDNIGLGGAYLLPFMLPVLVKLDGFFLRGKKFEIEPVFQSAIKSPTHYASSRLELQYQPGSDVVMVKVAAHPETFRGKEFMCAAVEAQVPMVIQRLSGARWVPNLECVFAQGTKYVGGTSTQSTYVPETTASGWSDGQHISVTVPGRTVSSQVFTGGGMEVPDGVYTLSVKARFEANGSEKKYELGKFPEREEAEIKQVFAEINRHALALAEQRNAADRQVEQEQRAQVRRDKEAAEARSEQQVRSLMREAGFGDNEADNFLRVICDDRGALVEAIAADRAGRGVLVWDRGAAQWLGHWNGAEARIEDGRLQLKVVDPAYTEIHMTARRVSLKLSGGKTVLDEWCDRIGMLAVQKPALLSHPEKTANSNVAHCRTGPAAL